MKINDDRDLGKAIRRNESRIEIEGDLAKKVLRIKSSGPIAWATLIACVALAIPLVIATVGTGGTISLATVPAISSLMAAPIATIGAGATISAINIAIGGALAVGGIASAKAGIETLQLLKKYKVQKKDTIVILIRK